jgi:hypothetical protein
VRKEFFEPAEFAAVVDALPAYLQDEAALLRATLPTEKPSSLERNPVKTPDPDLRPETQSPQDLDISGAFWLRGLDLNQRPLGYERVEARTGNP